jgi:pimeloyl-ACP methyl ester carboxylesterase
MAAVQKPLSIASFTDKAGAPAWKTIPSWFLVSTHDQMIPPPAQEFFARRMGATVQSVSASHASMIAHPQQVADLILQAANGQTEKTAELLEVM